MGGDSNTGGPVLVTGATGRHGGTGLHLVHGLRDAGWHVRVLVRVRDERVSTLEAAGAEVAIGDLHDRNSLVGAMKGAATAYFTYPINKGVIDAAAIFASAAREAATVERIVVMSMGASNPQSPSHLGRAQAVAEEVLAWAGLDLIVLRVAALFFENIHTLHARTIRNEGVIRNNFGATPVPWIGGADAGALGLAAVLHPHRFKGASVHYPPGTELMSHPEIAAVIADAIGRPVRYECIDTPTWQGELEQLAGSDGGAVNVDMARHISAQGAMFSTPGRAPIRAPDAREIERLTGRAPQSLRSFIRQNAKFFAA